MSLCYDLLNALRFLLCQPHVNPTTGCGSLSFGLGRRLGAFFLGHGDTSGM
jgi:hypothetical protein